MTLVLLLLFAGLAAALAGLAVQTLRRDRGLQRRLAHLAVGSGPKVGTGVSLQTVESATPQLDGLMRSHWPRVARLETRLAQSGGAISLGRHGIVVAGFATAVFIAVAAVAGVGLIALGAAALAALLPGQQLGRRLAKRSRVFMDQFPDAIELVVRALSAGLPLSAALTTVGEEFADPAGVEFRRVVAGMTLGQPVDEALWDMVARVDCPELRFFTISIATQQKTGGNLAETLANLADMLRGRAQMRLKIKAMTGEARASAMVLGALPFAIGLLMALANPAYLMPLFTDPRGWMMLGTGAGMLMMGVGAMSAMIKFDV